MQALQQAIKEKRFPPAYFLHGEDEFRKEDALRHLIAAAVDPATRDFNLDQRRGPELGAEALGSLLAMPPMMAERRMIVIRDVAGLRKDAREALTAYLAAPSPDVLVVLTAAADAKADKTLEKLAVTVDCAPLTGAQLPKWIVTRVEKQLGGTITSEAVELLQDVVGADLGPLALELDKLVAFTGGGTIDEAAVAQVVGIRKEETIGQLLDAVGMRDSARAIALIPGVLRLPKTSAVTVVMALTTQTLALAAIKSRNVPPARLSGAFFDLLRRGSSNLTFRAWGEAVSAWSKVVARWSLDDLDHALAVLLQTDFALKQSRVSSEEQVLASGILAICGGAMRRSAA